MTRAGRDGRIWYQALREANGGDAGVQPLALVRNLDEALHQVEAVRQHGVQVLHQHLQQQIDEMEGAQTILSKKE